MQTRPLSGAEDWWRDATLSSVCSSAQKKQSAVPEATLLLRTSSRLLEVIVNLFREFVTILDLEKG